MKNLPFATPVILMLLVISAQLVSAQTPRRLGPASAEEIANARKNVDANMDDIDAHRKFVYAMGIKNPQLLEHYRMWNKQYPQNVAIPLSIATAFRNAGMPESQEFYLRASEIQPENAHLWFLLSVDADQRGEKSLFAEYISKALALAPSNSQYAYYFLNSFNNGDPEIYKEKVHEFIALFPEDKLSGVAISELGVRAKNRSEKIQYFEQVRKSYSREKFDWSPPGMEELTDIYLEEDRVKALALINEMGKGSAWDIRRNVALSLGKSEQLEQAVKYADALAVLDSLELPRRSKTLDDFVLLKKALLSYNSGDAKGAYDRLAEKFAFAPTDTIYSALVLYGTKTGREERQVKEDIRMIRNRAATPSYPFELGRYTSDDSLHLEALKGKVVLLTLWFPGCGPCKAEFPHFQSVVDSFESEHLAYIGINVMPLEDGYVLPFVENNKYSFIPLRGNLNFAQDKFEVDGFPANFLIDKEGKIVYRDFYTGEHNHRTLELMIASLLEED